MLLKGYYIEKVKQFIKSNPFPKLNHDPTQEFSKRTNNDISKSKITPTKEKIKLKVIRPQAPKLIKGQPKTHKVNMSIRHVVNHYNALRYNLSKYLNGKLKNYIHLVEIVSPIGMNQLTMLKVQKYQRIRCLLTSMFQVSTTMYQ